MADFRELRLPDDRPTGSSETLWPTTTRSPRTATAPPPPPGPNKPPRAPERIWTVPNRRNLQHALRIGARITGAMLIGIAMLWAALLIGYRWINPPATTLMVAQRLTGTAVTRYWRSLEQISPHLTRAVIVSEDAGFCGHRGVDWKELEAAYERGLDGGNSGGASTISMQAVKNLFLWPSKSYVRKAIEIPLTLAADRWWGKPRMIEIYLNIAEWGPGLFGAEAAARTYFSKSARDLNETEAALLAVALPNPTLRNAAIPSPRQRRLATVVQGRMKAGASNVRCIARTQR